MEENTKPLLRDRAIDYAIKAGATPENVMELAKKIYNWLLSGE